MAKLHFYFSAMNAGKSSNLLQSSFNYQERGMETLLYLPECAVGDAPMIASRIGLQADALAISTTTNLFETTVHEQEHRFSRLGCVLIDEAQFLTQKQVKQLCRITDELNLPVLAYGIRTDFQGEPFEGSQFLLSWSDHLIELKTICFCGKKATMNLRINENGQAVRSGDQVLIGKNDHYIALCRKHFFSTDRLPESVFLGIKKKGVCEAT